MSVTRSVSVAETFHLDMSTIPAFVNQGVPDVELQLTFRAPHLLSNQRLITSCHRKVLIEASITFKGWIVYHPAVPILVLVRDIDTVDRDCKGFREFLIFLYTKELSPLNLVRVVEYAMQFHVTLDVNNFKAALSFRNAVRLLEKFQAPGKAIAADYLRIRGFILEKIDAMPMENLSSAYFLCIEAPTLEVIIGRLVGRVNRQEDLVKALLGWAKIECDRQGLPQNFQNYVDVLPCSVIEGCRLNTLDMDAKAKMAQMMSEVDKKNGTEQRTPTPPGLGNGGGSGPQPAAIATSSQRRNIEEEPSQVAPSKTPMDVKIRVIVKTLKKKETYEVSKSDMIIVLKQLMGERSSTPVPRISLQFGPLWVWLNDGDTFEYYNIKDGDTIYQI